MCYRIDLKSDQITAHLIQNDGPGLSTYVQIDDKLDKKLGKKAWIYILTIFVIIFLLKLILDELNFYYKFSIE